MKAELVKRQDRWDLYGEDGSKIASSAESPLKRLSLKNCQEIENGYDLDELSKSYAIRDDISDEFDYVDSIIKHFKAGLQKAFEIKSDKNFSEEDVRKAIREARGCVKNDDNGVKFLKEDAEIVQSIQPKEWAVEVVTENCQVMVQNGDMEFQDFPKLCKKGCLILKRV